MKKIMLLLHISMITSFGFSQCITTEDANNTVSLCKYSGTVGKEDLSTSNIIAAAAEETYSVLLKMRCPPRPSNSGQGEVTVQETAKNAPSRNWRAGYGLRQVGGPATVPALGPFPDWPGHSVCETGTIGP